MFFFPQCLFVGNQISLNIVTEVDSISDPVEKTIRVFEISSTCCTNEKYWGHKSTILIYREQICRYNRKTKHNLPNILSLLNDVRNAFTCTTCKKFDVPYILYVHYEPENLACPTRHMYSTYQTFWHTLSAVRAKKTDVRFVLNVEENWRDLRILHAIRTKIHAKQSNSKKLFENECRETA